MNANTNDQLNNIVPSNTNLNTSDKKNIESELKQNHEQ